MKSTIKKFWKDEAGLELVEYAVMGGLLVMAIVAAIGLISTAISNKFTDISTTIDP